jgi:hypothetical protein
MSAGVTGGGGAMSPLDQTALSIELVLISVIEAAAFTFLAENAVPIFSDAAKLAYIPFVIAGFLFILIFWSQSILHAVSFIRWPLRLDRMFIYFALAFVQSIAYSNLTKPTMWFFWLSLFSLIGLGLYLLDLKLIRVSRPLIILMPGGKDLCDEVERRHLYEARVQVPAALLFNLGALALLLLFPGYFARAAPLAVLGGLSALATLAALIDCMVISPRAAGSSPSVSNQRTEHRRLPMVSLP